MVVSDHGITSSEIEALKKAAENGELYYSDSEYGIKRNGKEFL